MINDMADIDQYVTIHDSRTLNEKFLETNLELAAPDNGEITSSPLTDKICNIVGIDPADLMFISCIEEEIGGFMYQFAKMGYEAKAKEIEEEKQNKIDGLLMRDLPSKFFMKYVENFYEEDYIISDLKERGVDIGKLLQYNVYEIEKCKNLMESKGHFANYLWNGDIDGTFGRADGNHQKMAETFVKPLDNERFKTIDEEIKWYFNHEPTWKYEWYINRLAKENNLEDGVIIKRNGYFREYYDPDHDYHLELTEEGSA